jgi:FixJ family two-component response regulator
MRRHLEREQQVNQKQIIAIIDDDPSVRLAISSLVRSLGLAVRLFSSAEQFLAAGALATIALVVTDVQMTGMSGLELQERLRQDGSDVPVIFVTAFPVPAIRQRALAGGACGFLAKPFAGAAMIRCIGEALAANPQRDALPAPPQGATP